MKKMHFMLFFVVGCVFLFFSCEVTEKSNSTISDLLKITNSNEQGEDNDDQGGKPKPPIVKSPFEDKEKPPVVVPPEPDPSENITVSISMVYGVPVPFPYVALASVFPVAVTLTLSEGSWNHIYYQFGSGTDAELNTISQWISLPDGVAIIESGYFYNKNEKRLNMKTENPKALSFLMLNTALGNRTATINEDKLDEMKAKTNIDGKLSIGIKTAVFGE